MERVFSELYQNLQTSNRVSINNNYTAAITETVNNKVINISITWIWSNIQRSTIVFRAVECSFSFWSYLRYFTSTWFFNLSFNIFQTTYVCYIGSQNTIQFPKKGRTQIHFKMRQNDILSLIYYNSAVNCHFTSR